MEKNNKEKEILNVYLHHIRNDSMKSIKILEQNNYYGLSEENKIFLQKEAIKNSMYSYINIENPKKILEEFLVTTYPEQIKKYPKQNNLIKKKILLSNPEIYKYIENPTKEMTNIALRDSYNIKYIENPTEEQQLSVIMHSSKNYDYIKSPTEKVKEQYIENYPRKILELDNPSSKLQIIALKKRLSLYMKIKNLSEESMIYISSIKDGMLEDFYNLNLKISPSTLEKMIEQSPLNLIYIKENEMSLKYQKIAFKNIKINDLRKIIFEILEKIDKNLIKEKLIEFDIDNFFEDELKKITSYLGNENVIDLFKINKDFFKYIKEPNLEICKEAILYNEKNIKNIKNPKSSIKIFYDIIRKNKKLSLEDYITKITTNKKIKNNEEINLDLELY